MKKLLKEVAKIGAGQGAPQGEESYSMDGIPFVKAGNLSDLSKGASIDSILKVSDAVAKKYGLKLYSKGTILFAKSGMSCLKGYVYVLPKEAYVVNHLACIMPKEDISDYLKLYFDYYKPSRLIKDFAYPSISLTDIGNVQIELFDEKTRDVIIASLKTLQSLIYNRKKQLELLDQLVKARFVEMFGDPIKNQKAFPVFCLEDVIKFQGGSQPDKKFFEYEPTGDNIRLIQIRDYKTNNYITYIPKSKAKRFCKADDIMIGRYGPPIFQILQGIEGAFNVALMKAIPKTGNKEFFRYFLKQKCLLEYLEGMSARTAGQDGIQMDKLKAYPCPLPPIDLQNQFADFVGQVDKSKQTIQQNIKQLEILEKSLMQKYFG